MAKKKTPDMAETGGETAADAVDAANVANVEAAAAIIEHIRAHIGPVDTVFHQLDEDGTAIDIHHVPPGEGRPCHTLVTTGMSDRPMPEGSGVRHAELVLRLPADWPMGEDELDADSAAWPLELMRALGQLPHRHGVPIDFGMCSNDSTLPFGMLKDTGFSAVLLAPPVTVPDEFWCLDAGRGRVIDFFGVIMLYPQELELARFEGVVALARKLDSKSVTELVTPGRKLAV